jgi:hypothetical protein
LKRELKGLEIVEGEAVKSTGAFILVRRHDAG